jgi:hypothetical protein
VLTYELIWEWWNELRDRQQWRLRVGEKLDCFGVDRGCSASRLGEVLQQVTGRPFIDGERWFTTGAKWISSGREATARRALRARAVR